MNNCQICPTSNGSGPPLRGREFGQAAVCRAGLSRNARPTSVSAPPFPTWAELTRRMADELYPQQPMGDGKETDPCLGESPQATLCGSQRSIRRPRQGCLGPAHHRCDPRRELRALPLHSLLLKLPGQTSSDDYDTLLERAAGNWLPEIRRGEVSG